MPLPALQEVLLKLKRRELNILCNLSKQAKKICDKNFFRELNILCNSSKQAKKICDKKNFRELYEKLHPLISDNEVTDNVRHWIKEYVGETSFDEVENIKLKDIVDILEMIENKTSDNKPRIIFYGEEIFSSKFVESVNKLKAGFIANSLFVGIIGSVVAECILEPERLHQHIEMYRDMSEGDEILSVESFLFHIYQMYDGFSSIFNLDETFKSETYRRFTDERGRLQYENEKVIATFEDVDIWDLGRLKLLI